MTEKELFSRLGIDSNEYSRLSDESSSDFDPTFPKPIHISPGNKGIRFSSVDLKRYTKERARFKNKVISIGGSLLEKPLSSAKEIANASTSIGLNPGVYFLMKGEDVVYVGQSLIAINRVGIHAREGAIDFDSFSILECEERHLNMVESLYIHMLRPRYNGRDPHEEDSPMNAPLNPDKLFNLMKTKSNGGQ